MTSTTDTNNADPTGADGEPLGYGDALIELEEILSSLENASADVDTLATKVRRATELVTFCRSRLDVVRADVAGVIDDLSNDTT